ncbi:hypothetical protein PAXRUDRAFT_17368 [Paxillus rubicundulus Ve08.2h10]|uniref:Uncharacterized protein n=1 Tax=Paxillus rubicundulus Ve08.2h10 TaxID=930991 RepID=A0A0D0DAQ7_9AGAM|nr:hypothetical protein PAXRUDRAFT_17368 [Paxillus rubicundulus Ve08.2h10]
MPPSAPTALLAQSAPSAAKKPAKQVAFEAAAAWLHTLALTISGDANNLEHNMWSGEWNVAMDAMARANVGTLAKGLTLQLPTAIIPSIQEADNAFGQIVLEAIAQKEAADYSAPIKPVHITLAPSMSSWATTQSQMEVVVPKGKGKKHSRQDLRADEAAPFPPPGMASWTHLPKVYGLEGEMCALKERVMGVSEAAEASTSQAPCPVQAAVPMAGPSVLPRLSMVSGNKEGDIIVVWEGNGKGASGWAKGVTVNKLEFEEVMWWLLICKSKVWDAQVQNMELEGEVLGLKGYINCLHQK